MIDPKVHISQDMEVHRSIKYRSLGVDSHVQKSRPRRPSLGERHQSVPLAARPRHSQSQSLSTSSTRLRQNSVTQDLLQTIAAISVPSQDPTINFVVAGKPRVGKSTFVRSALDLDTPPNGAISSRGINTKDGYRCIQLGEFSIDELNICEGQLLTWPDPRGTDRFTRVDGLLYLYDVTNEGSIVDVPRTLYNLRHSGIPIVLIACKSDAPMSEQEVGITFVERTRRSFPLVTFSECSSALPNSFKKCIVDALKAASNMRKLEQPVTGMSYQDISIDESEVVHANPMDSQLVPPLSNDFLISELRSDEHIQESLQDQIETEEVKLVTPTNQCRQESLPTESRFDHSNVEANGDLDVCTETNATTEASSDAPSEVQISNRHSLHRVDISDGGVPLPALIDRLLKLPTTKHEGKFVPAFLCLYRAFSTPRRLLMEIIDRFVKTDRSDLVPLAKVAELLRYLQVLVHWTALYPGDFAESSTRRMAINFTHELEQNSNFAPAAKEIFGNLLTIIMDDDYDWSFHDVAAHDENPPQKSVTASFSLGRIDGSQTAESDASDDDKYIRRRSVRDSGTASTTSSIVRSSVTSSQSATNLFNLDKAREQSSLFKTIPHIPISKLQWHHFMSTPTEELAREITRIDWTMYSAIRARDFVRNVSISSHSRSRIRHTDAIGMMVKHFNHLALFVSGMVLLRDKPKHRAKILEKFMDLAWKVRQQNNYNSLGAIVAGITGPEISRLRQTHELIPNEVAKQFLRLTVLMSISRSYSVYRMAWENSFNERIPFIPLVRQDLTMAASANPTFIGKNINWKKFEIMGDVIIGVQKSHEQPYTFPDKTQKSQDITRLIMETKVIEESEDSADPRSELYDRSLQLEPQMAGDTRGDVRRHTIGSGVKRTMTGWF